MISFFQNLFDTTGFPPRWYCGSSWTEELGWTHIIADFVIFLSYISIPIGIFLISKKRKYLNYTFLISLFIAFIILCGITHLIEASIFWQPWYRLSALFKVTTAIVSVITSIALIYYTPILLKMSDNLYQRHYLEYMIKNLPFPILITDKEKIVSFLNHDFTKYTGYTISDLVGLNIETIIPKKDTIKLKNLLSKKDPIIVDAIQILNKHNEVKNIELSVAYLNHFDNEGFMIAIKDLEKLTELNFISTKLNAIFDGAADAIIINDLSGTIQFCNNKTIEMFGYEHSEIIYKNFYDLIEGDEIKNLIKKDIEDPSNKMKIQKFNQTFKGRTKDNHHMFLEVSGGWLNIDEVEIYALFLTDVSERIKMENHIKRAYEELESFSHIVAHDLREPLRGIGNYSNFLIEDYSDKLDDKGIKMLNSLQKSSYRLENFIESLLHYSRISNQKNVSSLVDINSLIEDILSSLSINIDQKNIKIIFKANFPSIRCQKIKIREVFYNLISNAIRYNSNPEKIIEIGYNTIFDKDQNSEIYVFFVKDNGIGIDEMHHKIVFNMFKRLHGKDDFGGGSGAGLAIVKKIIEQHNGKIWIESEKGIGSTFYFTISNYE